MAEFQMTSNLPCSAEALRAFLGAPANLPNITDPDMELEVLEAPEVVTEGAEIEFSIMAFGFAQRMRHRWIKVTDHLIVAEQVDGPARSWRHEQEITDAEDGCVLTDRFQFEPPGGMMGRVITADAIAQSLAASTETRHRLLAGEFASLRQR